MHKIGVISNIFAKSLKNDPEYNTKLSHILGENGLFEVTRSIAELESVCKEFKRKKVQIIGVVGGDGTLGLVLSVIYKTYGQDPLPKILILKSGTINFLAHNLGIKSNALTCLEDFVLSIKQKQILEERNFHTLNVNQTRLGFVFGNALISSFLEEFYKDKSSGLGALAEVGKMAGDFMLGGKLNGRFKEVTKPVSMSIHAQPDKLDIPFPHDFSFVLASTVPKLAFGITVFSKVDASVPMAQLLASDAKGFKLIGLVRKALFRQRLEKDSSVYSLNFNELHIECPDQKQFSLDGDLIANPSSHIHISIGPSFTFVSPYKIV